MNTVTFGVRSLDESLENFRRVWTSRKPEPAASINFETPELLWKVLTAKRWDILKAMGGKGPLGLREIARQVERDVKAVHNDVQTLLSAGVIDKTDSGKLIFPYEAIHIDFTMHIGHQNRSHGVAA